MKNSVTYIKVLLPIRFREELTYSLPEGMEASRGEWVKVPVGKREYIGVIIETDIRGSEIEAAKIRPVIEKTALAPVSEKGLEFWNILADYYMCSPAAVIQAACPASLQKQAEVRSRRSSSASTSDTEPLPTLSPAQHTALEGIRTAFAEGSNVLLHGVTGSGKTEIYMHAAAEELQKGGTVLYLVPEIAISRQLQMRLARVFGDRLLIFHSRQTAAQRKNVYDKLSASSEPRLVLGTRSAIFLPIGNPGLIIVDEEHDVSYKQDEPAPRYNGRDAAMLLASIHKARVILGSATPSLESLFNVACGKLRKIDLTQKYFKEACEPEIVIIDTIRARKNRDMDGAFSKHLLNEIGKTVRKGGQCLIFRSRRAYATMVQCSACGDIPSCPKCGVPLTYHKFNGTLECHYCGYRRKFDSNCSKCGSADSILPIGAGTEKLEEELSARFPEFRIARFDSDTTQSKARSEKILKDFAEGDTDILVGTQMITKGFDFDRLSLVAVIAADSLLAQQDFRADERALQLLQQFRGRAGRRNGNGMMFIQTCQSNHRVFINLRGGNSGDTPFMEDMLAERKAFNFPPYARLITITVKDRNEGELWHVGREITEILQKCNVSDFAGPISPAGGKEGGFFVSRFLLKLPRNSGTTRIKRELYLRLEALELRFRRKPQIIIDVDPL